MGARILVADANSARRLLCRVRLAGAFYQPLLAANAAECLTRARTERPALVLLALPLPDMDCSSLLNTLRSDPATRRMPIIATLPEDRSGEVADVLSRGADEVMLLPLDPMLLLARIRNLMRHGDHDGIAETALVGAAILDEDFVSLPPPGRAADMDGPGISGFAEAMIPFKPEQAAPQRAAEGWIALVSRNPGQAEALRDSVAAAVPVPLRILAPEQAMELVAGGMACPDIFIIEHDMDGRSRGLRLMSALKGHERTRHAAFCILTGAERAADSEAWAMALDLGADDVLAEARADAELGLRLRNILRRKHQADRRRQGLAEGLRLSVIDPLTGLHNRRFALPRLASIASEASKNATEFAIMLIDLDRFKEVNDRFGHAAGDTVLREVAQRLTGRLRSSDLLARIGGEEFLVVLPRTSLADARMVAERLRSAVAREPVPLADGRALSVTASIGVAIGGSARAAMGPGRPATDAAENPGQGDGERPDGAGTQQAVPPCDVDALFEAADRALRAAKSAGRNLVTFGRSAA